MACLGAGIGRCIFWWIWPLFRVCWKREWGMWIFAVLKTSRGTGKICVTSFRWRAVDLEIIRLMHFWFAIAMMIKGRLCEKEGTQGWEIQPIYLPSCLDRKPWAIPSWPTASPGIRIGSVPTWWITLLIFIETNTYGTVTSALDNLQWLSVRIRGITIAQELLYESLPSKDWLFRIHTEWTIIFEQVDGKYEVTQMRCAESIVCQTCLTYFSLYDFTALRWVGSGSLTWIGGQIFRRVCTWVTWWIF